MTDDNRGAVSINEDARRRFEEFWAEGNPHPIEEFLPDETQPGYLPTLEELVLIDLEFAWKSWSSRQAETGKMEGETVVGPPQAETYVARFKALQKPEAVQRLILEEIRLRNRYGPPPQADEYRARFPQVELPDTVFSGRIEPADDTAGGQTADPVHGVEDETLPRRFGPYRLRERIGAGGMGVVYRAWQERVEREIAVKVLRTDRLAGLPADHRRTLIDRFRNEARATARIDHPQIVSVYDVGVTDGVPYYTMQYVTGTSLGESPQSGPFAQKEAARIIQTVAMAVQAAHDHGILHRDLKPHNIIIEESSQTAFVADFGLAKLLEDNTSQTVTGEILGTPQYMSPEQARDSGSVTTRSDVYALGATLYFLLTGQPSFSGRNHMEILRKVLDDNPVPPRQLNPEVDPDLEVICLKCLEKEPERRYASARALADDLLCWLEGEPIAARPPGRWERLRRWCRKNPLTGTLAVTAACMLVFAVVALWTGYSRASTAYRLAADEAEKAKISDERTRETINEFFTIVSEDVLLKQPGMQPVRRELLEKALAHYREFLRERKGDPELRAEVAAAGYRVGRITGVLESPAEALTFYTDAVAMQRALHREQPENADITQDLSTTLNAIGASLTRLDRADEALPWLLEARTLRQSLVDGDEDNVEYGRLLASTVMNIGSAHRALAQFAEARRHYETSIDIRTELLDDRQRHSRKLLRDQGKAFFNLANLECDQAFLATTADDAALLSDAARRLEQAIDHFTRVAQQTPDDFEVRRTLVLCFLVLGEIRVKQQDFTRAEARYATALELMRELAIENPRVPQYQVELARILQMTGQCLSLQGGWERALELYLESCDRLRAVEASGNATSQAISDLIQALLGLAVVHLEREDGLRALEIAEEALEYAEQLTAEHPASDVYAAQHRDVLQLIDVAKSANQ